MSGYAADVVTPADLKDAIAAVEAVLARSALVDGGPRAASTSPLSSAPASQG